MYMTKLSLPNFWCFHHHLCLDQHKMKPAFSLLLPAVAFVLQTEQSTFIKTPPAFGGDTLNTAVPCRFV